MRKIVHTVFGLAFIVASAASAVSAQSAVSEDLRATIMARVVQDPRAAQIPPEDMMKLVDALAAQAAADGITTADIEWQPITFLAYEEPAAESGLSACEGSFTCLLTEAFGFVGDNPIIPLYFLVASGLLMLLIRRMHRHHHAMGHFDAPKPVAPAQETGTL